MCDWNSGASPRATRSAEMSTSGRTKPSSLSFGQWSVCSAMFTGYDFATSAAYAANATDPVTMFFTEGPERYSAPPVETWTMPSEPASAKPLSAAFSVCEDDTLIAGNAKPCDFAASSISAYFSGVAMGMSRLLGTGVQPRFHPSGWHDNRPAPWFRLVDMDVDLREAFDQGFGPEPEHRPVSERVEAGHRAVRRRRLAGTVLTVAVAAVVGIGAWPCSTAGHQPGRRRRPDHQRDTDADALGRRRTRALHRGRHPRDPAGGDRVRRHRRPGRDPSADHHSVALDLQAPGGPMWLILDWRRDAGGPAVVSVRARGPGRRAVRRLGLRHVDLARAPLPGLRRRTGAGGASRASRSSTSDTRST